MNFPCNRVIDKKGGRHPCGKTCKARQVKSPRIAVAVMPFKLISAPKGQPLTADKKEVRKKQGRQGSIDAGSDGQKGTEVRFNLSPQTENPHVDSQNHHNHPVAGPVKGGFKHHPIKVRTYSLGSDIGKGHQKQGRQRQPRNGKHRHHHSRVLGHFTCNILSGNGHHRPQNHEKGTRKPLAQHTGQIPAPLRLRQTGYLRHSAHQGNDKGKIGLNGQDIGSEPVLLAQRRNIVPNHMKRYPDKPDCRHQHTHSQQSRHQNPGGPGNGAQSFKGNPAAQKHAQ